MILISTRAPALALLVAALALPAAAGATVPGQDDPMHRVTATRRAGPVRVDGWIDEAAWDDARIIDRFVEGEPLEGAAPGARTRVRVLFDHEALYVSAMMYEPDPSRIARQLVRRDDHGQYDFFDISVDPNLDRRTGYRFRVGASGVQSDAYLFDDTRADDNWDAVWESAVQMVDSGWVVEMRIPLSQLRYQASDQPQVWGINFSRRRVAANERMYFALESRTTPGRVSVYGTLAGLLLPNAARRAEIRPYVLARTRTAASEPGDPFFDGRETAGSLGADLRYGIGGTFMLDATINPDFGQVEVDPAVINLGAYETFFPERRPFFVEDARIFDFNLSGGDNRLFYSRRIGRAPRGLDLGADETDLPQQTSIRGAAKLTGRTAHGLAIGALAAVTARERGRAYFAGDDSIASFVAEPRAFHGVLRAQQDFRDGASHAGAIITALERPLPADGTFDVLPRRSVSVGVDFEHSWAGRAWALWGFFAGSRVAGDSTALIALQQRSTHYFQRPDAWGLGVDSSATSIMGREWRLQLEKRGGTHWTGAVWAAERSPGFDVNDFGYFSGSERLDGGARINYRDITPGRVFRSYRVGGSMYMNWRHEALRDPLSFSWWEHARKAGSFSIEADGEFSNNWWAHINTRYTPGALDDGATRGGPLMYDPPETSVSLRLSSDGRRVLSLEPSLSYTTGSAGISRSAGLEIQMRPTSRVELEVEPSYRWSHQTRQYVGATENVGFGPTYGPRYIFGALDRRSFSASTRLNVAFTPTLTLQLFAQPLLSYGGYPTYKALARAESFEFDTFTRGTAVNGGAGCAGGSICASGDEQHLDLDGDGSTDYSFATPDFDIRSLRGNAVVRWEYRPGSTLFVVWQQSRYRNDPQGDGFALLDGAGALVDTHPENVFIVKLSYWLAL